MTKKLVVGVVLLLLAVFGVGFLMSGDRRDTAPPVTDARTAPDEATPPAAPTRRDDPPTRTRIRAEPKAPADAPVEAAVDEPDENVDEPAEETATLQELLEKPISISLQSEPIKRALGMLSGMTNVPVYLDAEVAADLEKVPVTMEMENAAAGLIFNVMGQVGGGLTMAVEEDRIVLHKQGAAWKPEMATVKIEPIVPDPDAPTTFTVKGRVLDGDGRSVGDVAILSGPNKEVARTDESGSYSFESMGRSLQLRASRPMRVRSARFNLKAEFGDTVEHDFVLGPPAGALALTVRSTSGEPPKGAYVWLSWEVSDATDDKDTDTATLVVDDTGVVRCDFAPEGDVAVRVTDKNHAPVTETVAVRAGIVTEHEVELTQISLAERLREERVSFAFNGSGLRDVIAYISRVKRINIIISPALQEAVADTAITMTVQNATLLSTLDDLCASLGNATYEVKGRYVFIKPKPQ